MKRVYIYVTGFFLAFFVLTMCYFISYKMIVMNGNSEGVSPSPMPQSQEVDAANAERLTSDTKMVVQIYDAVSDTVKKQETTVPGVYIHMTQKELTSYLDQYLDEVPLDEEEKGLIDVEIISFSKAQLVLRKTYQISKTDAQYYLCDYQGEVVIYYGDKETVYEYTGIATSSLPKEEVARLKIGYYVKTQEELYSILENYSS